MHRWKSLAPVEEAAPVAEAAAQPAALCACGAAVAADAAFCAKCGRPAGERRGMRPIAMPLAIGLAVLTFGVGLLAGVLRGGAGDGPGGSSAEKEVAQLRASLARAERTASEAQERNVALRKQLMNRHDEVARQLAERNDALRKHLTERSEVVRKELAERDVSIGALAQRTEVAEAEAEDSAALRETLAEAEAQLKAWQDSQAAANRVLPAVPPAQGETGQPAAAAAAPAPVPEGADDFWTRFDAEHPNVNGRAMWEDSMRAAIDELGADHPDLRERAGSIFDANLRQAEGGTSGGDGGE